MANKYDKILGEYREADEADEKVKYDSADPTADYLGAKIVAGDGITVSEGDGDDENKVKISNTWMLDPVEEHWDISEGLPVDPEDGDRYISDGTDEELGWYDGYIYEWDEEREEWIETLPIEGMMVWLIFEMVLWVFFSGGWMEIGSDSFLNLDETNWTADSPLAFDTDTKHLSVDLSDYVKESDIYDILIDDTTTANMTYIGKADVGSATSSAVWRIARCDITSGTNVITYADGNGNFDNVWDDRSSLSYS